MREVAQKARMESENFENLLKTKQTELDLCMKEMEKLRMETDLHKKRVDEVRHICMGSYLQLLFVTGSYLQLLDAL